MVTLDETIYLSHYGILRRSGRYPWGSSNNVATRNRTFLQTYEYLKKEGFTDVEFSKWFEISTTQLRAAKTLAKNMEKQQDIITAEKLKLTGMSNVAIGKEMGKNESSVRALLAPGARDKGDLLTTTSEMLKAEVEKNKFIDIGKGVENHISVSPNNLNTAVFMLKEQGYEVHPVKIKTVGVGLDTEYKVLCAPGTTQKEAWLNRLNIKQISRVSDDGGRSYGRIDHPPLSISPKRVQVKYAEEGGSKADGVIYVRPGIEDISLGNNMYAQVRIKVGNKHFLKGMAIYRDDLPEGVDLLFNTNKSDTGNKFDSMKKLTDDPALPFASVVDQIVADKDTPKERVTSVMNLVNEEGDWKTWNRNLSSQFLSKQSPTLAKAQLEMTLERRVQEYDEIMALTNPTVKRKLLESFADGADSAAVHLKAAAIPRMNWHVILPVPSMKPTQIYAPNFENGETVVLVRYPHGGTFEIPQLTVNNKQAEARRLLGNTIDAVGIHHTVAEHLSGADFDGDTILVIPNGTNRVKLSPALDELKNFDPRVLYAPYEGMRTIDGGTYHTATKEVVYDGTAGNRKQQLMGDVSNLITDMTLGGASHAELARAVKHSMVVIDAEKHHLNYKASAIDNGIAKLKQEYQGRADAGASTLVSRKKQNTWVPDRKPRPQSEGGAIDQVTGRKEYVPTGKTKRNREGEVVPRTTKIKKLELTDDAYTLTSAIPTRMEKLYANHSNRLKELANKARLSSLDTPCTMVGLR